MEAERAPQNRMCPLLKSLCVGENCSWHLRRGCAVMVLAGLQAVSLREQRRQES